MNKTMLYARESVAFDELIIVADTNGLPIDVTGWQFDLALTDQAGSIVLNLGMASSGDGFTVIDGANGELRLLIAQASLTAIDDTTGDFELFGDLLGSLAGQPRRLFADVRMRVTTAGNDFQGGAFRIVLDAVSPRIIAEIVASATEAAAIAVEAAGDATTNGAAQVTLAETAKTGAVAARDVAVGLSTAFVPYQIGTTNSVNAGNTYDRAVILKGAPPTGWYSDPKIGGAFLGKIDFITSQATAQIAFYLGTFDSGANTVTPHTKLTSVTRYPTGTYSLQFLNADGSPIEIAATDRLVAYERGISLKTGGTDPTQSEINAVATIGAPLSTAGTAFTPRALSWTVHSKIESDWLVDDYAGQLRSIRTADRNAIRDSYQLSSAASVSAARAQRLRGPHVEAVVNAETYEAIVEDDQYLLTPTADVVIDSVNGDAGNAGTRAAPKAALANHGTPTTGQMMGLVAGSRFPEVLTATANDLGIYKVKEGAAPNIDCGGEITETWVKEGTATSVYYVDVTHGFSVNQTRLGAWEDGEQLVRVASIAACDALPGSYYSPSDESLVANPTARLYVHPFDSTNPIGGADGKLYETVRRVLSIGDAVSFGQGENITVEGLETGRQATNNGSIVLGINSTIRNSIMTYGHKHNCLQESGLVDSCVFWGATSLAGSGGTSLHVFFTDQGGLTNLQGEYRRAGFYGNDRHLDAGLPQIQMITSHAGPGTTYLRPVHRMNWGRHANGFMTFGSIDGLYVEDCGGGSVFTPKGEFLRVLGNNINQDVAFNAAGTYTVRDWCAHVTHTKFFRNANFAGTMVFENCTFILENGADIFEQFGGNPASNITFRNCIFIMNGTGSYNYVFGSGATVTLTNNLYVVIDGGTWTASGSWGNFRFDQLQGAGYELNSRDLTAGDFGGNDLPLLFTAGLANAIALGDFRINERSPLRMGDGAKFSTIGAQTHHDWQSGGVLDGPCVRWPTIPQTLEEARSYALNGWREWRFYQ